MDLKTWFAIGAEMDPISINLASMSDQTVRDLLQIGYRSKFPFPKMSSQGTSGSGFSGFVQNQSSLSENKAIVEDFSFTVYVTAFAPFNRFGPMNASRGDGNDRRFGYNLLETYRLRAESKMIAAPGTHKYPWSVTQAATPTDSYLLVPRLRGVVPGVSITTLEDREEKSEGTITDEDTGEVKTEGFYREGNSVRYHFHGNDDAFALWGGNSWLTSDIDIHADISFKYDYFSKPNSFWLRITGKISGDQFPAVETYVRDRIGNGVMLGVWQIREGDGPVLMRDLTRGIIGDKNLPMFDIDVIIIVENGFFTGVYKNGSVISLADYNRQFTDLPPVRPGIPAFKREFQTVPVPRPAFLF